MSDSRLKLVVLLALGLLVGFFVASLTTGVDNLTVVESLVCDGPALEISPFPGAAAHGLILFVGGHSKGKSIELRVEGFRSLSTTLDPSPFSENVSYYYSGRWSGPVLLSATAEAGDCQLRVAYRFKSALALR